MAKSKSNVKNTKNNWVCVGTVYEMNLVMEEDDVKIYEDGKEVGTRKAMTIKPKEFSKPALRIRTKDGIHEFRNIRFTEPTEEEAKESKSKKSRWERAVEMMDWNAEIGGDKTKEPTMVKLSGFCCDGSYASEKNKTVVQTTNLRVTNVSANVKPNEDGEIITGTTVAGDYYVKAYKPVIKDEEETGDKIVTLIGVMSGEAFTFNVLIPEAAVEQVEEVCRVGEVAPFEFDEVVTVTAGGRKAAKANKYRIGRKSVSTDSSFESTKVEWYMNSFDDSYEEPDEDDDEEVENSPWIDPAVMRKVLKAREAKLEELENIAKNGRPESKKTTTAEKVKRAKVAEEENPYDSEDELF